MHGEIQSISINIIWMLGFIHEVDCRMSVHLCSIPGITYSIFSPEANGMTGNLPGTGGGSDRLACVTTIPR